MLAVYSGLPCLTMREGFSSCFRCMGQHVLPAGSNLRNIVFRDQILFVELDHGFQFTIPDSCLLLLPDIPAVFTLTGKKRLSESCVPIRPFQFLSPREDQMTCPTLWVFVVRVTRRYTANAETDKKQPSNGELPFVSHRTGHWTKSNRSVQGALITLSTSVLTRPATEKATRAIYWTPYDLAWATQGSKQPTTRSSWSSGRHMASTTSRIIRTLWLYALLHYSLPFQAEISEKSSHNILSLCTICR